MIRLANKSDASRLAEILIFAKRAAYRPIFQNDFVSFQEMQVLKLALYYRDDPHALRGVYVWDDGIVKGMMTLRAAEPGADERELKELYIDPFFQGQGVGTKLMRHALSTARGQGLSSVFLWVLEENRRARQFYERFGYRPQGERVLFPGTEHCLLKYACALNRKEDSHAL